MYTGTDKLVLICAASTLDITKIKKIVYEMDPKAFVIVSNAREVLGEGFKK